MTGTTSVFATHYFMTPSGTPAAGGLLHVYSANTTSNMPSWVDKAQTTLNTNPITLDGQGQCTLWLEAGQVYDLVLKDNPLGTLTGTPGATIRTYEDVSGATSAVIAPSQWVSTALIPTYIGTRQFSVVGDQTALFTVGRRVRMTSPTTTRYATVISSVFSTVTTVTVGFNPANVVDTTISGIDVSLDDTSNTAMMLGAGSIIDLTGYTGSDVSLVVGQSTIYTVTAATSLLLRVATTTNQNYRLDIAINQTAAANNATVTSLLVNNALLGSALITLQNMQANGATQVNTNANSTAMGLDTGNIAYRIVADISTRTESKSLFSQFFALPATSTAAGGVYNVWLDTSTVWSSLGTVNFNRSVTALVRVTRTL